MSVRVFTLPDLGEGLIEAALVRWLVAVGDEIAIDQPVAEVETAKSIVEVPSPFAGTVAALHGAEGEDLVVGSPLIEVDADSRAAATEPAAPESSQASGNVLVGYGTSESQHTGRRRRGARAVSGAPTLVAARTATLAPASAVDSGTGVRHPVAVMSPVVRQLARTRGLDLASLAGSGPGGAITRRDVESARTVEATPAEQSAVQTAVQPDVQTDGHTDSRTGLTVRSTTALGMFRRTVAANMVRSRSEIPEATVWVDVDATDLWELRRRMRLGDRHPSLLSFIARFTLAALARYPVLASRLTADASRIEEFDGVNLGFAVDTPRGLMVPVVRRADTLTLRGLDGEFERLTRAAREGMAAPAELGGSTFTINNYGSFGVDGSAAIINHPEVAILGVGRLIERPWVVDGAVVPRRIAQLSLVFDHRVCDGGTAAGMLRAVADAVENPFDLFADAAPTA